MIDLHFHPFRKALQLSLNEMAVLREIYELSNNTKYGGWCIKSKSKIAETLDLAKQSVINIINVLELRGYVEYDKVSGNCRPTEMIREITQERENIGFIIKSQGYEIASAKIKEIVEQARSCKKSSNKLAVKKMDVQNVTTSKKLTNVQKMDDGVQKMDDIGGKNVQKIDTSIINNIVISESNIKEQKIDFSDMLIFLDIFSCIKSGVLEQEESIRQEWIKLTEAERQKAIEWARKVQEYRTPEQYVKNPVFLLRYKDFNSPPHRHVENTMAVGAKMTKEEKYAEIMPYCSSTLTIDNVASNFLNRTVEETLDLIMRGEYGRVKNTAARILAKKYPQVQALFDADYLLDTKFGKKL